MSGAETLSSCTTTFYLEEPFAFKINTYDEETSYDPGGRYMNFYSFKRWTFATSFTGRLEVTADLSGLTGSMDLLAIVFMPAYLEEPLSDGVMVPVQLRRSRYMGYNLIL